VVYGWRVVGALLARGHRVDLIITPAGYQVLEEEMGLPGRSPEEVRRFFAPSGGEGDSERGLRLYDCGDLRVDIASGSVPVDGVALVPCSMSTVSALATGRSGDLLERVGDVALKERRRLVIVPRETPLSVVHLRNLLLLAEAGAVVLPAMPGFYHRPGRVEELVDFIVGKVLAALGVGQDLLPPWDPKRRR
jgi:4-hydroxy-3-polyprenylbenzoate decarboxylase